MQKFTGDIIILHMCTKNHNHIMYGSRDTEGDRQNFLLFCTIFCPFSTSLPLIILKNKITKKKRRKICLEILSSYTHMCTINEDHIIYSSWNKRCDRQKYFSFWAAFYFFSPLAMQKIKILKLKKIIFADIIILHICITNDNDIVHGSWDNEQDRQTFVILGHFFPSYTLKT